MPRLKTFASSLTLAVIMFGSTVVSANAFHIVETPERVSAANSIAAFAANGTDKSAPDGLFLSPEDILHVRWCATRYLSYHATDNTYADLTGKRVACRSPY
jgi:hypothetical protein